MVEIPEHLHERYGVKKRTPMRKLLTIFGYGVLVAALAFIFLTQRPEKVSTQLVGFSVNSDTSVTVRWEIYRGQLETAFCAVRAQNDQRIDVGYAIVEVSGGPSLATMTYDLTTESRAVLAEVLGCGPTADLQVPPPDFPPGIKAPAQQSPGVAPTQ